MQRATKNDDVAGCHKRLSPIKLATLNEVATFSTYSMYICMHIVVVLLLWCGCSRRSCQGMHGQVKDH